jgi:quercetin dioxygenase-like cupin family protein
MGQDNKWKIPMNRNSVSRSIDIPISIMLFALLSLAGSREAIAQGAGPAMDAKEADWVMVFDEPRHRLTFEKDNLKIVSVNIPVGDTSMYHLHDRPMLYVAINGSMMRNQDRGSEWQEPNPDNLRSPGEILYRDYLAKPQNHRVENIGEQPFRLVGHINFGPGSDPGLNDGLDGVKPVEESNWFRAYRHRLAAGESTDEHIHQYPVVIVQTIMGNSDVTEHGQSVDEKTVSGMFSYHKVGVAHSLHNLGDGEVELVEVEIR